MKTTSMIASRARVPCFLHRAIGEHPEHPHNQGDSHDQPYEAQADRIRLASIRTLLLPLQHASANVTGICHDVESDGKRQRKHTIDRLIPQPESKLRGV